MTDKLYQVPLKHDKTGANIDYHIDVMMMDKDTIAYCKLMVEERKLREKYREAFKKYYLEHWHPAYHSNIDKLDWQGKFAHTATQQQFESFIAGAELARSLASDILSLMKTE